ncbi:MAG TPA: 7-carboxy-7-deazaguanine synthase QueE [Chitinophagales bacterium]|nr:7-carboxy-7-deazaguanine synthase QueE [Chitinophagales bacterium]
MNFESSTMLLDFDITQEIPVMEHFYTIQGEGFYAGTPAYFIRLAGCDVGCHWCDVKESWTANKKQLISYKALINTIKKTPTEIIVITGGEPLMYDLSTLTSLLKLNDYQVNIETSGSYLLSGNIDWICVSPKKFKVALPEVFTKANELKFIIFNKSDFEFAEKYYQKFLELNPANEQKVICLLQVEWSVKEKMLPQVIEYVKAYPHWKISTQVHKYIDVP